MITQSLSSFLRHGADAHYDGPIPAETKERIRVVESAERAQERAMSAMERAMKSLSVAYADVLKDSAMVEASEELQREGVTGVLKERRERLAESAAWLACQADKVQKLAQGQ